MKKMSLTNLPCHFVRFPARLVTWVLIGSALSGLAGCNSDNEDTSQFSASIRYTQWGIPHIKADNYASLGYGAGYVYAKDNLCLMADHVVTVNGERSRYFGADGTVSVAFNQVDNLSSDVFFKAYLDDDTLQRDYTQISEDTRDLLRGYVTGYNRYLRETDGGHAECRGQPWLRPITLTDIYRLMAEKAIQGSGGALLAGIVAAQPPATALSQQAKHYASATLPAPDALRQLGQIRNKPFGSNAYALGRDATTNGRGMLLGNPHFPWATGNRFYQLHLTIPSKLDVMGVTITGMPTVVMGFNQHVAWSHTVSATQRFTLFELTLDPNDPTRYRHDGEWRKMTVKTVEVAAKNSTGQLETIRRRVYFSHFGPMLINPPNLDWSINQAFSLRDANLHNARMLDQWLGLNRATSTGDAKQVLQRISGLPWVNTIMADRQGDTLYADIGSTPNVSDVHFQQCMQSPTSQAVWQQVGLIVLDGSRSDCNWTVDASAVESGLYAGTAMPYLQRTDYVANSNDSYWLSNPYQPLTGFSPVFGAIESERSLRTRLGILQIQQRLAGTDGLPGRGFDSLATLQSVMFGNRVYAAELALDSLVAACQATPAVILTNGETVNLATACNVLAKWDRKANLDSRGAVLFYEFWRSVYRLDTLWAIPFDIRDPINTPNTLNIAQPAVQQQLLHQLALAVRRLSLMGIDPDTALGEWQYVMRQGQRIPLHGCDDLAGCFNQLAMTDLTSTGYTEVTNGPSYLQTVTWSSDGPIAEGMLTYGQSTDPASPHFADQTIGLYNPKRFSRFPYTEADIVANPAYRLISIRE
ncbi:acylase [Chitinivorax sp. B]|uniref:acylase n=1 Tax=Chitinivorax sp. B TaxID=2502235 RepID=UPI0010F59B6C|nr:acylase [Chitinivorax sp. B]